VVDRLILGTRAAAGPAMQEDQDITVQAIEEETARSQGLKELQSRQQHLEE
jgi:hypothetical protein